MERKLKGFFIGDGVVPTGFSRVMHGIIDNLPKTKFEIAQLAVNYFGDPHEYSHKIFPAFSKGNIYGYNRIKELLLQDDYDFIFLLNDAWVINAYLKEIKKTFALKEFKNKSIPKIIVYFPIDAMDHDPEWYTNFDIVDKIFVYTEFAKDVVLKANPKMVVEIMPHGIDKKIFYPLENKLEVKREIYPKGAKDFEDSFIVLNANRNQPRKRIDISLQAFAIFSSDKPLNVKMYYHGGNTDAAINVAKLAKRYGIVNRLILTDLTNGVQRKSVEKLNKIYNATDIGINTSVGEGWGLVSMEHTVTRAAQIVPAHSSCLELFGDCGVLIEPRQAIIQDNINTTGGLVHPADVAKGMEMLYTDKDLRKELEEKSYKKFTSSKYSWKTIAKRWARVFENTVTEEVKVEVEENEHNVGGGLQASN